MKKSRRWQLLVILFFALHIIPAYVEAQQSRLTLHFGPGNYTRQDLTFSPFVHGKWSMLNTGVDYYRKKKNVQFAGFELGIYKPAITDSYTYDGDKETSPHVFTLVNLWYGYGKSFSTKYENRNWSAGGIFEADVEPSSYNFAMNSNFGYFASFSLGIWGAHEYIINEKNTIAARATLPLLSLVARSPYLVNDDEFIENTYSHSGFKTFFEYLKDGKIQTLNRIQQFELRVNYQYRLNEKWAIGSAYEFRFIHASVPTNFLSYRNTFFINGALHF